jgi:hypothetical protein
VNDEVSLRHARRRGDLRQRGLQRGKGTNASASNEPIKAIKAPNGDWTKTGQPNRRRRICHGQSECRREAGRVRLDELPALRRVREKGSRRSSTIM